MKFNVSNKVFRWLIICIGGLLFCFAVNAILSSYLESEIEARIRLLNGELSSVSVNLVTRTVNVNNFEWSSATDSVAKNPHFIQLSAISLEGIHLYDLLIHKRIVIARITLDSGTIQYNKSIPRPAQKQNDSQYKSFLAKNFSLVNIQTQVVSDTVENFSAYINCNLGDVGLTMDTARHITYSLERAEALIEKISLSRHEGMYSGTIASVNINTIAQTIIVDSAELIPNYGKYEFAQRLGKQTGRLSLSIPKLTIEGHRYNGIRDSSFVASKIKVESFNLFAFKDKRIPFLRKENVPLPMEAFLKIPFLVKIDSILISNSLITIEEFPEGGINTGIITFNEVNATLTGLNNQQLRSDYPYAHLQATGLLMGTGKINALFKLPLDGVSMYTAKGYISGLSFKDLNTMLTPMANVRVESGYLNKLTFDFKYNEFISKGNTDIDYKDLQLVSLNTNKKSTNEIKTFFINVFVKNKRSKSLASAKKNGVIDIERDRKRYIFNVWVKSILDGIKSSIL